MKCHQQTFLGWLRQFYNMGREGKSITTFPAQCRNSILAVPSFKSFKCLPVKDLDPARVFPFGAEDGRGCLLRDLVKKNDYWLLKYHLALIQWNSNSYTCGERSVCQCGNQPVYTAFFMQQGAGPSV